MLFLVNRIGELKPTQTTTGLVLQRAHRGETWIAEANGFGVHGEQTWVRAARVPPGCPDLTVLQPTERRELGTFETVTVRLNPARDPRTWITPWLLGVLEDARARGVTITNAPAGLRRFGTKAGLRHLPSDWIPESLVTTDATHLVAFVRSHDRSVLKPASGTQGRGVFILHRDDANVRAVIEMMEPDGPIVAQEWVEEAVDGDQRILLLDGEILEVDGCPAVVRRRPQGGELRSNVHLGAVAEPGSISDTERALAAACGPVLREAGVRLAGLDCVGGKVLEANVWSPGGLEDMAVLQGLERTAFYSAVLDALG